MTAILDALNGESVSVALTGGSGGKADRGGCLDLFGLELPAEKTDYPTIREASE